MDWDVLTKLNRIIHRVERKDDLYRIRKIKEDGKYELISIHNIDGFPAILCNALAKKQDYDFQVNDIVAVKLLGESITSVIQYKILGPD